MIKTETEKAIEFCGNVMYQEDVCDCEEDDLLYNEEMKKVIALLQQGEKYQDIFETIVEWSTGDTITYNDLVDLEQKYFPKELPDEKTTKL